MGEDGGARTSRALVGWGEAGGGWACWVGGGVEGVTGCLLINSCNFLKPHRLYIARAQVPLKKENPGTLTYWFHAHGKGPEPISERTQQSYCLLGLWSPLIWKFNYFITRSGAAFWQSTVAPCQLHQCGGPEAPDSEREAFQTLTCFWGTRLLKCVAFKDWKLI